MTHKEPHMPPQMNMLDNLSYYLASPQVQEFILSFNTTICFGMALIIFIAMRNSHHIINDNALDSIAYKTAPYFPTKLINFFVNLDEPTEYDVESQEQVPIISK